MRKSSLFLLTFLIFFLYKCGLPSPDSVSKLNAPVIVPGVKTDLLNGYFTYSEVTKSYSPNSITFRVQAYQPERDFSGFNIYINNSIDTQESFDDGTIASIQTAHQNHYYYNSTDGSYPKQQAIEARFIIPAESLSSGLYPSISVNELATINTETPPSPSEPVFPALQSYPVEFKLTIYWDGKGYNLTTGEKVYNIAITAVDVAGKIESSLSNIIKVRFTGNVGDGDPDYSS